MYIGIVSVHLKAGFPCIGFHVNWRADPVEMKVSEKLVVLLVKSKTKFI